MVKSRISATDLADPNSVNTQDLRYEFLRTQLIAGTIGFDSGDSDEATQFLAAIVAGAAKYEALVDAIPGGANQVPIISIMLTAPDNYDYEVWLFDDDPTTTPNTKLVGVIPLYASDALQYPGDVTNYYYDISDLHIPYIDSTGSSTIHCALVNNGALATTGGGINLKFGFGVV